MLQGMRTTRRQTCDLRDPLLNRRLRLSTERIDSWAHEPSSAGRRYGIVRIRDIGEGRSLADRDGRTPFRGGLSASASEIAAAVECERRQIAAELHDGISQHLALLKLQIEGNLARGFNADEAPGPEDLLRHVVDSLQTSLREIRKLNNSLTAPGTEMFGLVSALHQFCASANAVSPATGVSFETPLHDSDLVPPACGEHLPLAIYRIAQEAVSNALRHGEARTVRIRLLPSSQSQGVHALTLSVEDDGRGFEAGEHFCRTEGGGLGLRTMRQRAFETGGELLIRSVPGGGTELRASWRRAVLKEM